MAEQEQEQACQEVEEHDEQDNPNYKIPAPKGLDEIINADAEDESLRKYKETLLGQGATGEQIVIDDSKDKVIVNKMTLIFTEDRDPMCIDLTNPEALSGTSFTLKEGAEYNIQIHFNVQREIVTGLKYEHKVYRKGIKVDALKRMLGSYGPKKEEYNYMTGKEEAPKGLIARGDYKIKSSFMDDDKTVYLEWEWNLSIKKDW